MRFNEGHRAGGGDKKSSDAKSRRKSVTANLQQAISPSTGIAGCVPGRICATDLG
jgi:hypothetical protein